MTRHKAEGDAIKAAATARTAFGFCVFDGWHYTGTVEQLQKIGCLYIQSPLRKAGAK